MAWQIAYELDWRAAHAALGTVNLAVAGTTLSYDGVTWTSANPQASVVSWQLEATGLRCIAPNNSRFTAGNHNAPHLYATLYDLALNTSTPFEADPSRQYLFQCYVSDLTLTPADGEGAMMGIYRQNMGGALGNANVALTSLGQRLGVGPQNWAQAGTSVAPPSRARTDRADAVLTVHWVSSQRINFFSQPWDGSGDWPANGTMRSIGSYRGIPAFDNDLIADPQWFRVAMAHNSPTFGSAYDGTIQRFRVQQQVRPQ